MAITNSTKSTGKASSTQFLECRFCRPVEKIKCNKSITVEKNCADTIERQNSSTLIYNVQGKICEIPIFVVLFCFCE